MRENELVELMYVLFGVGIVALAYYPKLFGALLPLVALVGAFYLVWGILSRIASSFSSIGASRRDDWWNGLAILTVIVLIYGQQGIVVKAVSLMVGAIWGFVYGIAALAL